MGIDVTTYYTQYSPMVLRRCRSLLKNENLALDAMQDTFVKLIKYQDRLRDHAPSSLLYRMATNVCLNQIRSMKRHPETQSEILLHSIASLGYHHEARTGARLILDKLFQNQKESTRMIATLHYLDGFTLEEVAEHVKMSVSGVRKRLRGLREQLKLQEQKGE